MTNCKLTEYQNKVIADITEYAEELFKNDFSGHDFFHTKRVYSLALNIAEKENADIFIVSLAALLHDADDRKLSPLTFENKDNARNILIKEGVSEDAIEKIIKAISEVSFEGSGSVKPSSLEGCCVQDADRIDAIGAIGIARAFAYGGSHSRKIYDPLEEPKLNMSKEEYRNSKGTSINHFYEKLLLLKDMINTSSAKAIAEERTKFMEEYLNEFYLEWEGKR